MIQQIVFGLFLIAFSLLKVEFQAQTLPSYVPSNGLVGWWPFNGNANDESGNGNHGNVNGAMLTADRNGELEKAYNFNNVSNHITINGLYQHDIAEYSISIWIKKNLGSENSSGSIVSGATCNPTPNRVGLRLFIGNDNQFYFGAESQNCLNGVTSGTTSLNSFHGSWHHLVGVFSAAPGLIQPSAFNIYFDGILVEQYQSAQQPSNLPISPIHNQSLPLIFGNADCICDYFQGQLDDIAIYNRALTQEEITALYTGSSSIAGCTNSIACNYNAAATQDDGSCTFPAQTYLTCDGNCINDTDADGICDEMETPTIPSYIPTNGLVGYWPFNGNANDESGNGYNGTVNGATLTSDRNGNSNSAYSFSAAGQNYIQAPSVSMSGSMTFSCWYNMSNFVIPTNDVYFFSNQSPSETIYQSNIACGFRSYQGEFGHSTYIANPLVGYYGTNNLPTTNDWHHIVYVFENGTYLKMYLDDLLIYSNNTVISNANLPSKPILFGSAGSINWFYSGLLDDIAIYSRALTQGEITALYTGSSSNNNGGGGSGSIAGTPAASVPAGIPYQAVIRDNAGAALVNTPVTVRFTLHENTTSGTTEYQETQSLTTNTLGLINTQFGAGIATQGTFAGINWSNTTKFIQVEANTGAGYVDMGTQQMMSVPFAIQANKATAIKNAGLPVYADNAAALAGGLVAGEMYRTANGDLKIVF